MCRILKKAMGKSGITNTLSPKDIKDHLDGYKTGCLNLYGMGNMMHNVVKNLSNEEPYQNYSYS